MACFRLVGNDVVDLGDPHIAGHHRRVRFVARVCAAEEVDRVAAAADPHALLWSLFAAKEAAFKAVARLRPGIAFAPRRFVVDAALTCVTYLDLRLRLTVAADAQRVHAVACAGDLDPTWVLERLPAGVSQSDAARRLAVRTASAHLHLEAASLEVVRLPDRRYRGGLGPPQLHCQGRCLPVAVSLSHDGAWVACALLPHGDEAAT